MTPNNDFEMPRQSACWYFWMFLKETNTIPNLCAPLRIFLDINLGTHFWLSECSLLMSIYQIV